MDMLADGLAWLTGQLETVASQEVTYARGYEAVAVPATLGKKLLKLDDGFGGIRMQWTDMDFLIPAALLVLSGAPTTPQRGDLIYLPVAYDVETYEVLAFGNDPPWRWCDPGQTMLRIHTKRIDPNNIII